MPSTPSARSHARLARRWGFGPDVQCALNQALERWDGQGMPNQLRGEAIARPMRVTQFALDAKLFFQLGGVEAAVAMARQRAGRAHDPAIVARFCADAPHLLADLDGSSAAGHRVRSTRHTWPAGLSDREVGVLRLVAQGLGNREMAERLGIAERTVHHHIQHIYQKLSISTRAAATLFAMQHNLLVVAVSPP
jgi:ATP/maltotriose-dependent transcriptional regulator MalT